MKGRTFLLAVLMTVLAGCGGPGPSGGAMHSGEGAGSVELSAKSDPEELQLPEEPAETIPEETETVTAPAAPEPPPSDDVFVRLADYIPDIVIDLKYATEDNFTGSVIYGFSDAYLRYGTVKKLAGVQDELRDMGMGLKIWDAFRPVSAQFRLWEVYPVSTYVANPNTGYSSHSRGNTVDITLVDSNGAEVQMPTGFDDFSLKADRDYSDCDEESAGNARLLENLMREHGFKPYSGEWWHFADSTTYEVEKTFEPPLSS